MTRINVVPPKELSRQHLVAEYRELPRVFKLVKARQDKGYTPTTCAISDAYRLGSGHVTFFYDKLVFLKLRQNSLIKEMKLRGYSPKFSTPDISEFHNHWKNDYQPTNNAMTINRKRIAERST